jgi:hypothetical protein
MEYNVIIANIIDLEDIHDIPHQWDTLNRIMDLSCDLVCITELYVDVTRQLHKTPRIYLGYQMTSFGMITIFSKLSISKMISYPDISEKSADILDIILDTFNVRIYHHSGPDTQDVYLHSWTHEVSTFSRVNPEYVVLISSSDVCIHNKLNVKHDYAGGLAILHGRNINGNDTTCGTVDIFSTISLIGLRSTIDICSNADKAKDLYGHEKNKSQIVSNLRDSVHKIFKDHSHLHSRSRDACYGGPQRPRVSSASNYSSHIHNLSLRGSSSAPSITSPRDGKYIQDRELILHAENGKNDKRHKFRNILNFWHAKSNKDEPSTDE